MTASRTRKPKLGDIVLMRVDPRQNNGAYEAPAMIVNLVEDEESGKTTVSLKVHFDSPEVRNLRGIELLDKKPTGEDIPNHPYAYPR
jgi:hypothetical protein